MFFKRKEVDNIKFEPEIVFFLNSTGDSASIRVASGDTNNFHNNINLDLKDNASLSLQLSGFDKLELVNNQNHVTGSAQIKMIDTQDKEKLVQLCDHKILITNAKTVDNLEISIAQIKEEISRIWGDAFGDALTEITNPDVKSSKSKPSKKRKYSFSISSIVNFVCIVFIALSIVLLAFTYLNKRNHTQSNGQETIANIDPTALKEESLNKTADQEDKTADQEAMEEFGLKEGIKLD